MSLAARTPEAFPGTARAVHAWAPGRVNPLGAHTDDNDGCMLPVATPRRTEGNGRVREARGAGAGRFGEPMNDSHASLRDGHAAPLPMLGESTDVLRSDPDVHGARLTGAGFGGACVALCRAGTAAAAGRRAVSRIKASRGNATGAAATLLIPASNPSQDHNKRGSDE